MNEQQLFRAISDLIGDMPEGGPIWEIGDDSDGQIIIYTGLTHADREGNLRFMEAEGGDA